MNPWGQGYTQSRKKHAGLSTRFIMSHIESQGDFDSVSIALPADHIMIGVPIAWHSLAVVGLLHNHCDRKHDRRRETRRRGV